ncbi:hypothetical protein KKB80_03780 [bacterium]|nr:hypothetical protein [bacterium]
MVKLGYAIYDNKMMDTNEPGKDGEQVKGYYSDQTNDAYINDRYNSSTTDLLTTAGHEMSHAIDARARVATDETYADIYGSNLADYTNFALNYTDQGTLADTNTHNTGQVTSLPSVFNDNTYATNNAEFSALDKSEGDDLVFYSGGQFSVSGGTSLAASHGNFANYKFEDNKLVVENGTYNSVEAGAGSPSAGVGGEFGIAFTSDVKNVFAGAYLNNGGAAGPFGIDVSSTSISDQTKQSSTGITINVSPISTNIPEGHSRIGKTYVNIENKQDLIDFSPIVNFFKNIFSTNKKGSKK